MPKKESTKKETIVEDTPIAEEHYDQNQEIQSIQCNEFDIKRLSIVGQELKKDAVQVTCFPRYLYNEKITPVNKEKKSSTLLIVTDPIKMSKGGIPRHNPKYHGTSLNSSKRAYFFVPKDENDSGSKALFDVLEEIDAFMDTEVNKNSNKGGLLYKLKDKAPVSFKNLTYSSMVNESKGPTDDEDDDDNKKKYEPYYRVKVRLDTLYDKDATAEDDKPITTQLFIKEKDTPEPVETISDIEKYFSWNCTARFVLAVSKVWIMTGNEKKCSITIKCKQIQIVELSEQRQNPSSQLLGKSLFAKPIGKPAPQSTQPDVKSAVKPGLKTHTVQPKADASKKKVEVKKDDDEDDDDEDEEDKDEDEDDEEDEEDKDEDEDDDDASEPESEDEKPKKSNGKKTSVKETKIETKVETKVTGKSKTESKAESKPADKKKK